jgi:hypothetical protein
MRRYVGIAVGLGLLLVILSFTNAGPALAQGAVKPVQSFIVNGSANPVPVRVVAPPPTTTTVCTLQLDLFLTGGQPILSNGQRSKPVSLVECPAGVTVIDVSRILYLPDLNENASALTSLSVSKYRLTVGHAATATGPAETMRTSEVLAMLTDGAPAAADEQPYRLDVTSSEWIRLAGAASGMPGFPLSLGGSLMFIGTPVQ